MKKSLNVELFAKNLNKEIDRARNPALYGNSSEKDQLVADVSSRVLAIVLKVVTESIVKDSVTSSARWHFKRLIEYIEANVDGFSEEFIEIINDAKEVLKYEPISSDRQKDYIWTFLDDFVSAYHSGALNESAEELAERARDLMADI